MGAYAGSGLRRLAQLGDIGLEPDERAAVKIDLDHDALRGVDLLLVDQNLVIEVIAGREARGTDISDHLALVDPRSNMKPVGEFCQMGIILQFGLCKDAGSGREEAG